MAALPNIGGEPVWPLPVDRYHAMIDAGILGPDDHLELLEGVLIEKMSKNPPHEFSLGELQEVLTRLAAGWLVRNQGPITLASSEPEPDLVIARGTRRDYVGRHPSAADVALVVEIADSSVDRDRILKKRIYATAGIPFYWLLNLANRRLEVYSGPKDGDYSLCNLYRSGDSAPVILDGQEVGSVAVEAMLP